MNARGGRDKVLALLDEHEMIPVLGAVLQNSFTDVVWRFKNKNNHVQSVVALPSCSRRSGLSAGLRAWRENCGVKPRILHHAFG